jgi:membrane protein YqaA with SNARE-associated domain
LKPAESAARDLSVEVCAVPTDPAPSSGSNTRVWLRILLGAAAMFVTMLVLVRTFRAQLEALGRAFVEHFGLGGIALGSFLADGVSFPLPPQFYMLLAIGADTPDLHTLLASAVGSLLGGAVGYHLARQLARFARFARWLERTGAGFREQLRGRKAYRNAVIASLTPVPFSVQCYLCGLYRLPLGAFAVILCLRLPRLAVFYYVIKAGWTFF